jgi:hypothetical protein
MTGLGLGVGAPFTQFITSSAPPTSGYYYQTFSGSVDFVPLAPNDSNWLPTTKINDADIHGTYEGGSGFNVVKILFDAGSSKLIQSQVFSLYYEAQTVVMYWWDGNIWQNWSTPLLSSGTPHQWHDSNNNPTDVTARYMQLVLVDSIISDPPTDARVGNWVMVVS